MSMENDAPGTSPERPVRRGRPRRPATHLAAFGIAAFAVLAIGAAGGAAAIHPARHRACTLDTHLDLLPQGRLGLVTLKGKVTEIYGNKFIVQDETGKALIETGPAGDDGKLVAVGEPISVQGRFDDGFLHASYVVHQDGKTDALRPPPGPPPHGGPSADMWRKTKP
jgi:hypothetical protein